MPADKSKKPRFGVRRDDDDNDDDDRPRKKRRRDDDDDRPRKKGKAKGNNSAMFLWLGGGIALVLMLSCCGVGGYFAFFYKGSSPLGVGDHFTITSASVNSFGRNTNLALAYDMKAGVENTEDYYAVMTAGGKKYEMKMTMLMVAPGGRGSRARLSLSEFAPRAAACLRRGSDRGHRDPDARARRHLHLCG